MRDVCYFQLQDSTNNLSLFRGHRQRTPDKEFDHGKTVTNVTLRAWDLHIQGLCINEEFALNEKSSPMMFSILCIQNRNKEQLRFISSVRSLQKRGIASARNSVQVKSLQPHHVLCRPSSLIHSKQHCSGKTLLNRKLF